MKTFVKQTGPWGLFARCGHRLMCSDGKIRAAELASSGDTFFSVPARIRINGKTITGYYTVDTDSNWSKKSHVFRHHTVHNELLPTWPKSNTMEHEKLIESSQ
jgi:hypothetical protein